MILKQTVVRWADDAKNWVVDLALQIGDDLVTFTDLVITDMKDAFHVIGGFFQTLGATSTTRSTGSNTTCSN